MRPATKPRSSQPLQSTITATLAMPRMVVVFGLCLWAATATAQDVTSATCRCVADTSVLATGPDDLVANFGSNQKLLLGGPGRCALFRFDISDFAGHEIVGAKLRVRRVTELLTRVGVSTLASSWAEGTRDTVRRSEGEHPQFPEADGASYRYARGDPDQAKVQDWAWAGGCFADVSFGNGGSRWASVVAAFDKQSRWYEIDIPAPLVQAMADGVQSSTLCLMDQFNRGDPLIEIASRETEDAPQLVVQYRRTERRASPPPSALSTSTDWRGLEWLRFEAPTAIGFEVYLSTQDPENSKDLTKLEKLASWALPSPGTTPRSMMISAFRGGVHRFIGVRACDPHGDWSDIVWTALPPRIEHAPSLDSPKLKRFQLPSAVTGCFTMDDGPSLSMDGRWMRSAPETWWNPTEGPIQLEAGGNEFVAFQVVLAGGPGAYRVTLADWKSPGAVDPAPHVDYFKAAYVRARMGKDKFCPDPLMPIEAGETLKLDLSTAMLNSPPMPTTTSAPTTEPADGGNEHSAAQQVAQVIWVDMYIPRSTAIGKWTARVIALRNGETQLDIPLELEVVRTGLPDALSYPVELRCDEPPGVAFLQDEDSDAAWQEFYDAHRIAHAHRLTLAVRPYKRDGSLYHGFAPTIVTTGDAPRLDFSEWDERFGKLLDGSAFRDLPREAQPITHLPLPFHENWPVLLRVDKAANGTPIRDRYHFQPTYTEPKRGQRPNPRSDAYLRWPIEQAVSSEHNVQNQVLLEQFLKHLGARGWTGPEYQVSLANHPRRGEMSSWWALGAPQILDDYSALRWFLQPYRVAITNVSGVRSRIRQDTDDPSLSRGLLDGVVDSWVVGTALSSRNYALFPRTRDEQIWRYEDDIRPEMGMAGIYRWAWDGLLSGATGLTVRQSLGKTQSWEKADDDAFLYPGAPAASRRPIASMRLKALRRAQQDFEWLSLWRKSDQHKPPEGYYLGTLGQELIERTGAKTARAVTLVPILQLPPAIDTVAFEELRRGMRAKAAGAPPAPAP